MTRSIALPLVLCCLSTLGCSPSSLIAELDRDGGLDAGSSAPLRELCGNGVDDDSDGRIDDGCPCGPREMQRCFPGPIAQRGVGTCADGVQRCVPSGTEWGDWGDAPCEGATLAQAEVCDGQDHDCDGARDEDCSCTPAETRECGASFSNAHCMAGTQSCTPSGVWTECVGAIGPSPDVCDGVDNDCDGVIDLGCACVPVPEVCDDGVDNDCDGRIDEPACRPDWPICTGATPGWVELPTTNAPTAMIRLVAVWTGTEVLVWETAFPRDMHGRRFDWARQEWSLFTNAGEPPSPRRDPAVAWTGREMLVWGGWDSVRAANVAGGSAFDPAANMWRAMSTMNEPSPRDSFASVWTGRELIVWGGQYTEIGTESTPLVDGGIYDPSTDTWRAISTVGAPAPLSRADAVWTGQEMIVWHSTGGGIFNPSTNTWRPLDLTDGPGSRFNPIVVWTGQEMAVWSGSIAGGYLSTGKLFNPSTNRWRGMNTAGAPLARSSLMSLEPSQAARPTAHGFIVWGGLLASGPGATGAIYDAATEIWTAIPEIGAPESRYGHVAVWTGCSLFVWGGHFDSGDSPGGIWTPE